ncbi:AAA family ATPase [Gordonia otitidis]|uniref:ATPase n=1 Tax=Gordonia otitidis (strain DSM 44809 / CCUG 52243 / JCM 12355 / NBRC 100426 / IFM 10032) TaxID=1108044 RepID=H5TS41_GORO1|nr:AAA family ATPase [Gordonia otitidis]GAB36299.1 putative ATPase [Gordonia otitidis NBRC 100426]
MLMFGFVVDTEFGDPDDTTVVAATSGGLILQRQQGEVSYTRRSGWKFGRSELDEIGALIESKYQRTRDESKDVWGPALVDVPDQADPKELVSTFERRIRYRTVPLGSVDEFVRRSLPSPTALTGGHSDDVATTNGGVYQPRTVGSFRDVDVIRSAVCAHAPVLLRGPYGSGKSALVAAALGSDVVNIRCFEGIGREDVVGMHTPTPGTPGDFTWVDGPLLRAMVRGEACHVDDVGWMAPGVQALFLPLADDARQLEVVDRPDPLVTAAPGFSLVFSENPGVGWGLIGPLHNRLAFVVDVPIDYRIAARAGVPPVLISVAEKRQERSRQTDDHTVWLPSIRELLAVSSIEGMFGMEFAAQALLSKCPNDQRDQFSQELSAYVDIAGSLQSS